MHNFVEIKRVCNGMMPGAVYERIYYEALRAPAGSFVEVGTGHGAGTVCLALALKDRGIGGTVFTLDRMEGGSRARYGDAATNSAIAARNFERFGVNDVVRLIIGEAADICDHITANEPIGVLFLDADGRIDREIGALYDYLAANALVVIDDCEDFVKLEWTARRTLRIDLKHKLTFELVRQFREQRLFVNHSWTHQTVFCNRTPGASVPPGFSSHVIAAYRQLVFTNGRVRGNQLGAVIRRTTVIQKLLRTARIERVVRRIRQRS